MDRLCRKLKSRRGASILVALLVLFVCLTAGTAALTAAGANAGRYTHMRTDQQRYLAVASAARLVRAELCGQTFTAKAQVEENLAQSLPEGQLPFQLTEVSDPTYTGAFGAWLLDDLKTLFRASAIPDSWWDMAGLLPPNAQAVTYDNGGKGLGLDVSSGETLLSQVKWSLTLDDDYTLIAKFYLADGGARYYPMVLTIPARVEEETSEPQRVGAGQRFITTKTVTVTWKESDAVITQN